MDQDQFWNLQSGRTVEEILYTASLKLEANFKYVCSLEHIFFTSFSDFSGWMVKFY